MLYQYLKTENIAKHSILLNITLIFNDNLLNYNNLN